MGRTFQGGVSESAYLGWRLQQRGEVAQGGRVARTSAEGTRIPERKGNRLPGRKTTDNVDEDIAPEDKSNWRNWGKERKEKRGAPGRKISWDKFQILECRVPECRGPAPASEGSKRAGAASTVATEEGKGDKWALFRNPL